MRKQETGDGSVFELELRGFDGASDATDDRIVWVRAISMESILEQLDGAGLVQGGRNPTSDSADVVAVRAVMVTPEKAEFALPADLDALVARIGSILATDNAPPAGKDDAQESVEEVAEHVLRMQDKYDFVCDADSVRDAVCSSAELLGLELDEAMIAAACDRVLNREDATQPEPDRSVPAAVMGAGR